MKADNKKSAALVMRHALLKAGASEEHIKAALAVLNPKAHPAVKVTRELKARIVALLDKPGARVMLVRGQGGVRVYRPETLEGFRNSAKKHKPYLKTQRAVATAKNASTADATEAAA